MYCFVAVNNTETSKVNQGNRIVTSAVVITDNNWDYTDILTDRQTNKLTNKLTDGQTNLQTNLQTDKQTNTQTDRHTSDLLPRSPAHHLSHPEHYPILSTSLSTSGVSTLDLRTFTTSL